MNKQETITTDNRDASQAMTSAALDAAAAEIKSRHRDLMGQQGSALEAVEGVLQTAKGIAAMVEQVHAQLGGARFAKWWREMEMPVGWGHKYLTIARTAHSNALADKNQLRLVGLMPEPQGGNQGKARPAANSFAWIKWSGKIAKTLGAANLESYDDTDRIAALKHLEPVERIIIKLRSGLKSTDPGGAAPPLKESLGPGNGRG